MTPLDRLAQLREEWRIAANRTEGGAVQFLDLEQCADALTPLIEAMREEQKAEVSAKAQLEALRECEYRAEGDGVACGECVQCFKERIKQLEREPRQVPDLRASGVLELIARAREATTALRDAARTGIVIEFRQRDPLVLAIHGALDAFAALIEAAPQGEDRHRRACECAEPDPVMQADLKFYCYTCSFETGARPPYLFPEMERLDAAPATVAQDQQTEKLAQLIAARLGRADEWLCVRELLKAGIAAPATDLRNRWRGNNCPVCGAAQDDPHTDDCSAMPSTPSSPDLRKWVRHDPACPLYSHTGWVIEQYHADILHYWTGDTEPNALSSDHTRARRFSRYEDAACMLSWHLKDMGRVVEHSWGNPSADCTCGLQAALDQQEGR